MSNTPLHIENLAVDIGRVNLFKNVSLDLDKNRFVTVMGENGVGKTVLIETMMGYIKPTGGSIEYWGQSIDSNARSDILQKTSWVLSQREDYPLGLTVDGLLKLVGRAFQNWDVGHVNLLVEKMGLDTSKPLLSLSLGEQSKVKLIKALGIQPRLIILDELTANLSPSSKDIIIKILIDHFSNQDLSVLYFSHSSEEALRLSDEVLILTSNGLNRK